MSLLAFAKNAIITDRRNPPRLRVGTVLEKVAPALFEIQSAMNKSTDRIAYLYQRWQDEKAYEDFRDYVGAIEEILHCPVLDYSDDPFWFGLDCSDAKGVKLCVASTGRSVVMNLISKP